MGGACVDVKKFSDEMYNKAFSLTMEGQRQIVAKVLNPNAGLPRCTTASDMANMDFWLLGRRLVEDAHVGLGEGRAQNTSSQRAYLEFR